MMNHRGSMGSLSGGQGGPMVSPYPSMRGGGNGGGPMPDSVYGNFGNFSGPGGSRGMGHYSDDQNVDDGIDYLAARAHAARILAAEESKRLEENLMRLEMRRMMMDRYNNGGGGGSSGDGMDRDQQRNGGQRGPYYNFNGNSLGTKSSPVIKNDDHALMARAQNHFTESRPQGHRFEGDSSRGYNMPQVQSNMNDGRSNGPDMPKMASNFNNYHGNNPTTHQGHDLSFPVGNYSRLNDGRSMNAMKSQQSPMEGMPSIYPHMRTSVIDDEEMKARHRKTLAEAGMTAAPSSSSAKAAAPNVAEPVKPAKDTSAPRRPLSAYNIFFSEMREIILKENEAENDSEKDQNSTPKDEALVEDKETIDKKEEVDEAKQGDADEKMDFYDDDKKGTTNKNMADFTQNLMKKRLDAKATKRLHRRTHGKVAFTTLAQTVGKRWRELPEEKKVKYKELAELDRARYRQEKQARAKALREESKRQRKEAAAAAAAASKANVLQ